MRTSCSLKRAISRIHKGREPSPRMSARVPALQYQSSIIVGKKKCGNQKQTFLQYALLHLFFLLQSQHIEFSSKFLGILGILQPLVDVSSTFFVSVVSSPNSNLNGLERNQTHDGYSKQWHT